MKVIGLFTPTIRWVVYSPIGSIWWISYARLAGAIRYDDAVFRLGLLLNSHGSMLSVATFCLIDDREKERADDLVAVDEGFRW